MKSITFTAGGGAVTIDANIVYGTDFFDQRLNQFGLLTADGTDIVYDGGPIVVKGAIILKGVSYTDGDNFRTWIKEKLVWALNKFKITAVVETDWGLGKNTALETVANGVIARYDGGSTLKGVFDYVAPGQYNINFPYRFTRE